MTINITLPPSIEQYIVTNAEVLHLPIEAYVLSLVEASVPKIVPAPLAGESDEDFTKAMMSLSETATPSNLPCTTRTRAEIYLDHD